ncbi:Ig-like domain-containing protein [Marinobacter adhaerens]|uniref:Ig-like domain-containing protein n=1 Tax=Marinobacter adhaerens TaxID=1033846 RepID=A0A851HV64_9GAMM|nr:Ig-like domain-containing protein [Marinobacter adhaerens]NWN92893.1 Ig-like domain-containing protein [Marinobacter adhaerens]
MRQFKLLALVPAMFLAACGGDDKQVVEQKATPGSVIYSYPADGQADVSPAADIVLRFSSAITEAEGELQSKINLESGGNNIDFRVEKIDGGKSLKLTTEGAFNTGADYSITFNEPLLAEGGRVIDTPNSVGEPGVQFQTRGSFSGIASDVNTQDDFKIAWSAPSLNNQGAEYFEAMDFSTFRIAMTQPIHPEWQKLGGSIELLGENGEPVHATVLVKGNRITVDPCVETADICGSKQDTLNAGETYTLKLSNLASLTKDPENEDERFERSFSITPKDTGSTVVLQQSAVDSNQGMITSTLNGQAINSVTLNSVLQGEAGPSQQGGDLFAELAPNSPDMDTDDVLLRIPKGSVLTSTSLDVLVGGKVPVTVATADGEPVGPLQTTGDIKVTMLSDATGYMRSNPYTDELDAPRHLTLFMDVSMNTEEAQPNAALSQDLMSVQLRGIAEVIDGILTIDAVGMVEPGLLGQEFTDSTIAFHLEADTNVDSALDAEDIWKRERDTTPPKLVSWMPGDKENAIPKTRQSIQRPGDPVILFFDEPLDPDSIAEGVSLLADGSPLKVGDGLNADLDGTALTLNPEGGLKPGVQYKVSAPGLTDLAGNSYASTGDDLSFSLDGERDGAADAPPLALTTYPGYPCETTHDAIELKLEGGTHGQCWDAAPNGEAGDVLPLSEMPADRPITVVFSQPMNLDSIQSGKDGTFIVEKVDADKNRIETEHDDGFVSGRLEKNNQRIRFYPDEPWEEDEFYRYTMKVNRSSEESKPDDSCKEPYGSICGTNDLPLKTDLLEGLSGGGEGDNSMIIYFKGVPSQDSVFTALRNLPVRDTNADFQIDCESNDDPDCLEPFSHTYLDPSVATEADQASGWLPSANSTKLRVKNNEATFITELTKLDARVGCETDKNCPKDKFIYQTYALNTEVVGPGIWTDPETGEEQEGILVNLYPTQLATSSINTYVKLLGNQVQVPTNTQIIRMRYSEDPDCKDQSDDCPRNRLIPGAIVTGDEGQPVFKTKAELMLDAPDMEITADGEHDLYATTFHFDLVGDVTFFDDGRMQIEQRNKNVVNINVEAKPLGLPIKLPLEILPGGTYLNFISNPVKDLPAQYQEQVAQ